MKRHFIVELTGCTIVWHLASLSTLHNRRLTKQIQLIQLIQTFEQAPVLLSLTNAQKAVSVAFVLNMAAYLWR